MKSTKNHILPLERFQKNGHASSPAPVSLKRQGLEDRLKQEIIGNYYDPMKDEFMAFMGVIQSLRFDGLTFLTERPVKIGESVLLRRKTPLKDCKGDPLDEGTHVEVVSCTKADGLTGMMSYRIRVQYY